MAKFDKLEIYLRASTFRARRLLVSRYYMVNISGSFISTSSEWSCTFSRANERNTRAWPDSGLDINYKQRRGRRWN